MNGVETCATCAENVSSERVVRVFCFRILFGRRGGRKRREGGGGRGKASEGVFAWGSIARGRRVRRAAYGFQSEPSLSQTPSYRSAPAPQSVPLQRV